MIMLTHYIGDWLGKTLPIWKKFSDKFTATTSMLVVYVRIAIFAVLILLMVYPIESPII